MLMKRILKKGFLLLLMCVPVWASAQTEEQAVWASAQSEEQVYREGDTLWVNDEYNKVAQPEATMYGLVRKVDTASNTATVQYFIIRASASGAGDGSGDKGRLRAIRKRVAAGDGKGLWKGKQLYFNAEGKVEAMEVYTLVHEERPTVIPGAHKTKVRNRLAQETLLYPDGKTKDEVILSYKTSKYGTEQQFYTRKCYYPDGTLQYEEVNDEEHTDLLTTYYDKKGKVVKKPKQPIEPYMQMPEYPGGQKALFEFLSTNVQYPKEAQESAIQGRVIVQFVVAKDGKIDKVKVARTGGHESLDAEAVRVIKSMPRWQPGMKRGKPVRVKYTVPVNFRLQ